MKFYLLHLKLSGIKNISEEIQIDFYNKVITKFDPELFKVKAIYGENGSGKTAIVTAINVAKKIMLSPGYLKQVESQTFLREIINKKSKEFHMEFVFAHYDDKSLSVYKYGFSLTQNSLGNYELSKEYLEEIDHYTRNKKFVSIYEVVDGRISSMNIDEALLVGIKENTMNTLTESPLAYKLATGGFIDAETALRVITTVVFFLSINVYLDEEDMHEMYLINQILNTLQKGNKKNQSQEMYSAISKQLFYIDSKGRDVVDKKDFPQYRKKVERLQEFIRIFKHDLKTIKIDKRDNGTTYICELILDYGEYTVNREFESTGIKKLIRIFDSLVNADEGRISFIDEIDSNVNSVYLCKIVEYFMNYSKGQLCFTTHNLDVMSELKRNKCSIDFLSTNNKIVSWKVTGNAAPDRYYKNGMIEHSPLNVDAIDFIGAFGE